MLERIQNMKLMENQFSKSTMRWKNFTVAIQGSTWNIQTAPFEDATDQELLAVFEVITKRFYSQM